MKPFFVAGKPVCKGSKNGQVNRTKSGKLFATVYDQPGTKLKKWEKAVYITALSQRQGQGLIQNPVRVRLYFQTPRPKSHLTSKGRPSSQYREYPTSKMVGDIDKLSRAVLDGLTGSIYTDDSQVIRLETEKHYSEPEGVWIEVVELSEDSTK